MAAAVSRTGGYPRLLAASVRQSRRGVPENRDKTNPRAAAPPREAAAPVRSTHGHRQAEGVTMSRMVERKDWQGYFDRVSKGLEEVKAELEVAGLAGLGDRVAAEWIPLIGITYDRKDDLVDLALDPLDHMIRKPREIWVDENGASLESVEVIDGDDVHHIARFRDPLRLPAP
jgi:hypothetical protein